MIRSAKMNATTPPKLMPPFHSTPASGTLPIEQTKLSMLTTGPISGPQTLASARVPDEEQVAPEAVRHPSRHGSGNEQTGHDVADDSGPFHYEDVGHRGDALPRAEALPQAALTLDAHVHRRVTFHRPRQALFGLCLGRLEEPLTQEQAEEEGDQDDHERSTYELGQGELPPMSRARMTPSSTTRLVEAISNAMAAVKLAPLRNSDRARATAAYEHDDEAAPRPAAIAKVFGPVVAQ